MKVSIIIPTYNRPKLLRQCVDACLQQSSLPYEIIIGDDSKGAESKELVEQLQKKSSSTRIRYFKHSPSKGQIANVNFLIDQVQGDYTILIHDDDFLLPNCIGDLSKPLLEDPSIDASFGKQYLVDMEGVFDKEDSINLNKAFYRTDFHSGSVLSSYESGILLQFPNNGYLIKSEVIKNNQYSSDEQMVGDACDFHFGFNLGIKGYRFYFVNSYTAAYRVGNEKVSSQALHDSALKIYLLVKANTPPTEFAHLKNKQMKHYAPTALMQAINRKEKNIAKDIFLSKHHFPHLFTLGGVKRSLLLMKLVLTNK